MKFHLVSSDLYDTFRSECEENHAWYNADVGRLYTWSETFELMGFKTYKEIPASDGYYHWLSDEEYVWFMLRFS